MPYTEFRPDKWACPFGKVLQELVLLLFDREKLSLGKASRILGLTQLEFQALLTSHNLYIHYDVEDLHEDVKNLQELGLL